MNEARAKNIALWENHGARYPSIETPYKKAPDRGGKKREG